MDCYRALHATQPGYTHHSEAPVAPVARIDYVFASSRMAARLRACVGVGAGPDAASASDHLPLQVAFC